MSRAHYIRIGISNSYTSKALRFIPQLRELRFIWQINSHRGKGVQEFVHKFMPDLRRNNPTVRFRLWPTTIDTDAWILARYEPYQARTQRLEYKTANQVLAIVEKMAMGGDTRYGGHYGNVHGNPSRGWVLLKREHKGHDVYKVFSKRNAD